MTDDLEFKIGRLDLRPGDVLVLKTSEYLSTEMRERICEYLKPIVGDHRCLILERGMDLAVLTAAEIAARSTAPQSAEDAA